MPSCWRHNENAATGDEVEEALLPRHYVWYFNSIFVLPESSYAHAGFGQRGALLYLRASLPGW